MSEIQVNNFTRGKNNELVIESLMDRKGYFIQELKKRFKKWNLDVKFYAHNLLKEMRREKSDLG